MWMSVGRSARRLQRCAVDWHATRYRRHVQVDRRHRTCTPCTQTHPPANCPSIALLMQNSVSVVRLQNSTVDFSLTERLWLLIRANWATGNHVTDRMSRFATSALPSGAETTHKRDTSGPRRIAPRPSHSSARWTVRVLRAYSFWTRTLHLSERFYAWKCSNHSEYSYEHDEQADTRSYANVCLITNKAILSSLCSTTARCVISSHLVTAPVL